MATLTELCARGRTRKGAGRPPVTARDPTLLDDLERLLAPATMGDPMRPFRWVSKSHEKLATALRELGHKVGASTVAKLLVHSVGHIIWLHAKPDDMLATW